MKKIIFGLVVLILLIFSACKKSTPVISYPGGSWTFNTVTFPATACVGNAPTLTATDSFAGTPSCALIVYFHDSLPTANGTYDVVSQTAALAGGQVSIALGYVAPGVLNNYISTGGDGKEKVNVQVSNGKINISGSAIEMVNIGFGTDSSALVFNITQTQ